MHRIRAPHRCRPRTLDAPQSNGGPPGAQRTQLAALLRLLRPRSFVVLLASGFLAVGVPLVFGMLLNSVELDRLAEASERSIQRVASTTRAARLFVLELEATERAARQYQVLRDASRRAVLDERVQALQRRAEAAVEALPVQADAVQATVERIGAVPGLLAGPTSPQAEDGPADGPPTGTAARDIVQSAFAASGSLAGSVIAAGDAVAAAETLAMRERAGNARMLLLWLGYGTSLGVLALGVVAFALIARPIRQLDRAIRRLGSGHVDRVIGIRGPRDMVELGERLEWLRSQLAEHDAQKTRFLRHVSHELKTPLASLREGANLLREELAGPLTASQREVVRIVFDSTRRMESLINDLIGLTRLPHRLDAGEWQDVRLDEVVDAVFADHTLAMQSRRITRRGTLAPLCVRGTRAALTAVVDNLVSNAVKYCAPGGAVTASIEPEEQCVRLDVADDGPGIDEADRERVFEPFYRGHRGGPGIRGSGLGLTIARDAAAALGGTIEVGSSPSGGALLRVRLPRAVASTGSPVTA